MGDIQAELRRLRAALTASGDMPYDWNLVSDNLTWFSDGGVAGFQDHSQETNGEEFNTRVHPEDLGRRLEAIAALEKGTADFECEFRLQSGDGEYKWYHDRGIAEFDELGRPTRIFGTMRQVSRRMEEHARIEFCANYDELTGHFNRTRLRESLDQALYYSTRYGVTGAFLVVGIDNINMVNQAFGYDVADAVIVAVGHRLDRCLRACDIIGRIGGDRFGVVLSNCPAEDLHVAAEKILEVSRNTEVETQAGPIHVTVSIGAAVFPDSAQSSSDAITKADIALQSAKRSGRNTWSVYRYTEAQREGHRRNMVIAEQVKQALRDHRLILSYQPIVRSDTLEPEFHECLLRMRQPDGEIVVAGQFMPVVEELGLVRLIDRRVLDLSIDVLHTYPDARLAVNVSALTAGDRSWLRHVVNVLRHERALAERLTIEITETAGLEDVEACAKFVSVLQELGCRVALDDFGAGYTSFRHLKTLAVDMVKIDGAFVRDLKENPANLIFIRSLLDLARNFDLVTVAECVEDADLADMLRSEGVNFLQGWAFGKPEIEPPWISPAKQLLPAVPALTVATEKRRAVQ
jgi:diguanylate cyclase (GGDEF)-like protein